MKTFYFLVYTTATIDAVSVNFNKPVEYFADKVQAKSQKAAAALIWEKNPGAKSIVLSNETIYNELNK